MSRPVYSITLMDSGIIGDSTFQGMAQTYISLEDVIVYRDIIVYFMSNVSGDFLLLRSSGGYPYLDTGKLGVGIELFQWFQWTGRIVQKGIDYVTNGPLGWESSQGTYHVYASGYYLTAT